MDPHWTLLLGSHVAAATISVILGAVQLRRPKAVAGHRLVGRAYVITILWAAVSSFWIRDIRDGAFSWLHVLSVVTLVGVVAAVIAIRRGDVRGHRAHMTGSWLGATGAMVFAVAVPDRLIPTYAMAEPTGFAAATACVVLTAALLVVAGDALAVRHRRIEKAVLLRGDL